MINNPSGFKISITLLPCHHHGNERQVVMEMCVREIRDGVRGEECTAARAVTGPSQRQGGQRGEEINGPIIGLLKRRPRKR